MSGPGTHYIIGRALIDSIRSSEQDYANQLNTNSASFNLGTIGPDFLFFNIRDWPGGDHLASPIYTFIQVVETIDKLKEKIKLSLEPLIEAIESAASRSALLSEMAELYSDLKNIINVLSEDIRNCVQSNITESNVIFDLLSHPIQEGVKEDKWWWFDTMHYRKTGEFAKQMYLKTLNKPDSPEHAFAMGYMTHLAGDLVGHPYVNTIVGGSYRLHPKRHKFVENYQDVWNFNHYHSGDFCYSKLFEKFELSSNELNKISKLISEVSEQVYKNNVDVAYGNKLSEDDIKNAYKFWMHWFKKTTSQEDLPTPRPYELSGEIQEVWEDFVENVSDFSNLIENINLTGNDILDGLLAALLAAVLGPIVLAAAAVDFLAGLSVTLGLAPVRYFMSFIYNSIYDSFYKYRFAVTLNGFAFPLIKDLDNPKVKHTYNPRIQDYLGNFPDWANFPKQSYTQHGNESHLIHPQSQVEKMKTTPSPKTYLTKTPDYYVTGNIDFDDIVFEKLAFFDRNDLDRLHDIMRSENLGNAIKLTEKLAYYSYKYPDKQIPNLSLDADRGMGYRCWKYNGAIDSSNVVEPNFTDR